MYAIELPSEPKSAASVPADLRAHGRLFLEALALGERTVLGRLEEGGPSRARFPSSGRRGRSLEAVVLNIGGGIAGGDSSEMRIRAEQNARLVVTTQAAEKIYRSDGATSLISVDLNVGEGASLDWMPQATILFEGARVERSITANIATDARLLLIEPVILGRTARGERMSYGQLFDRWRIRRGGKLIYADGLHLDGDIAGTLDRRAVAGGYAALATILLVAPDAESRLEAVREALSLPDELPEHLEAGASAWDGMLSIRLLGRDGWVVEAAIRRIISSLGVVDPPRIWHS